MTLTIPCLLGLEALVADEIKRLGLAGVRAENGRVHCDGGLADIPRLNINLRCGARVLMELGSFPAPDFEALFQGVLALPWEDFIPREGEFPVKGYSLNSTLRSVPACQAIVKKAAARRLGNAYGCETCRRREAAIKSSSPSSRTGPPCIWTPPARGFTSGATGPGIWARPCGRPWRRRW
ncbi:THUMP domain-containing protein [uncultured Oscillibacter sp.]|uniref:THUMP domain-containing protein n=1 Tax=uncultured Oscillibacter sp. TaxID=876091 RepID=UPI002623440F|nr:THUMP domain-containing protein [uncultured Oscillibacter sp.]